MEMSAKNIHIRIAATIVAAMLSMHATTMAAASRYCSSLLRDMSAAMKMTDSIERLPEGIHVAQLSYLDHPLTIVIDGDRVSHIGYSIFTKKHREMAYSPFFDMMERYALIEKLPMKRIKSVERELDEEDIRFDCGSLAVLPSLYGEPNVEFSLENIDGKKYRAAWRKDGRNLAIVDTPYTYGLLHGTSMEEDEENLISDLQQLSATQFEASDWSVPSVSRESLVVITPLSSAIAPIEESATKEVTAGEDTAVSDTIATPSTKDYLVKRGEAYFLDDLNSNRYYTTSNGQYVALCDPDYPYESLANILTSMEVPNSLIVDAKIILYNYRTANVSLPLSAMVKYFLDRGCTPFAGMIESNADKTIALLIMRNIEEGYMHLLRLTAPSSAPGVGEGTVTARFNPFIPISKISSLFAEQTDPQLLKKSHPKLLKRPKTTR